ncbi:cyclophilin-like fold protein [Streptomyces ardesiacus]|uniref:cyclophilin-like fold protein n=1 Tax=Streptomyces ardesiacus TaxID=285564 RepID=UPI0033175FE2
MLRGRPPQWAKRGPRSCLSAPAHCRRDVLPVRPLPVTRRAREERGFLGGVVVLFPASGWGRGLQSRRPRPGLLAPAHPRPEDFQGTERIADPPRELTTENAPEPTAAKAGDLAYYAPWGKPRRLPQGRPLRLPGPADPRPHRRGRRPALRSRPDDRRSGLLNPPTLPSSGRLVPSPSRAEEVSACPPPPGS